jgi:hypothetical protein
MKLEQYAATPLNPATTKPKATMWGNIHTDY